MERDQPCEYLDWDSTFFACRIARVRATGLDGASLRTVEAWCRQRQIDCLYFLAGADDNESVRTSETGGFQLVDVRVTLERTVDAIPVPREKGIGNAVRPGRAHDVPALRAIAKQSHCDSRFYNDIHFPRDRCDALYETWIEKSCRGYAETVLVLDVEGQPVGYVSCHLRESEGQIGLLAIAEEARGRGVARVLVQASLDWFAQQGRTRVSVVTQGRNVQAQRLYQKCGFLTGSVHLWYHRWFPTQAASVSR
jgi:dTDP-4-amino-4,6-dideoxy-D-galactose acyltransferase